MIEMIIVGTIGIGYAVVGTLQWLKGDMGAGIMWLGYSFAQIGLFLNLKQFLTSKRIIAIVELLGEHYEDE